MIKRKQDPRGIKTLFHLNSSLDADYTYYVSEEDEKEVLQGLLTLQESCYNPCGQAGYDEDTRVDKFW